MLPELLQRSAASDAAQLGSSPAALPGTKAGSGSAGSCSSAGAPAASGEGSQHAVAAAADALNPKAVSWRPDSLAWLEGVQAQAGSRYGVAAATYEAALQSSHNDPQTRRFIRERLVECHAAAGEWDAVQHIAGDAQVLR